MCQLFMLLLQYSLYKTVYTSLSLKHQTISFFPVSLWMNFLHSHSQHHYKIEYTMYKINVLHRFQTVKIFGFSAVWCIFLVKEDAKSVKQELLCMKLYLFFDVKLRNKFRKLWQLGCFSDWRSGKVSALVTACIADLNPANTRNVHIGFLPTKKSAWISSWFYRFPRTRVLQIKAKKCSQNALLDM